MSLTAQQIFAVKDLVTIVTGAASGLGLAIAETMAANGADVVLVDRNEKELKRVGEQVIPGAETAVIDVAEPDAISRFMDGVVEVNALFHHFLDGQGPVEDHHLLTKLLATRHGAFQRHQHAATSEGIDE